MTLWEIFVNKLSVLLITLATIVGFYSPIVPVVNKESQLPNSDAAEVVENTATTTVVIEEEEEGIATLPTGADLLELEKKIEELKIQINRELSERSPEPNLFTVADINNKTRGALVNILCLSQSPKVKSITGSGVIVDPRGVILTNAHVAQLFLLRDYPYPGTVKCTIRSGSPAKPMYEASLLYLPAIWIDQNKTVLTDVNPLGTGENDYSFLLINESLSGVMPTELPYLPMIIADGEVETGKTVVVAGYSAGFL